MRYDTLHRPAVIALFLALLDGGSLKSQVGSWQLVGGAGGITGQSLAHRPVLLGALGRDAAVSSSLRLGAELTMGSLPSDHPVCTQAACDSRELAQFGALSITGAIAGPAGSVMPYVRANMGAWLGRDMGATVNQSSRETGYTIAGEAGMRLRHIAAAARVDQLHGVRRGTLHIASIVVRVSF